MYLSNTWNSSSQRDQSILEHDDLTLDTRTFSRATKSQLSSSRAVDKTLKNAFHHRSECLSYSNASKEKSSAGFQQLNHIRDETAIAKTQMLTLKFWTSFQKHAVVRSDDNSSNVSAASSSSIPVVGLTEAISSLSDRDISNEVDNIVRSLGLKHTESLSWREYKSVCKKIFDPPTAVGENLSQFSVNSGGLSRSHSIDNSSSVERDDNMTQYTQSYSVLQRKYRGVGSIKPNPSHADITDFAPSESTILAPVRKDALCQVLKSEYRKSRKEPAPAKCKESQGPRKGYLQDIQKNKVAAIRNNKNLIPLKYRQVREKKAARDAIADQFQRRKEMIRAFKTVVNAQERNSTNKAVLNKDLEYANQIEDNAMKRYIENEIRSKNITNWRNNEQKIRHDLRAEYKKAMKKSVDISRQMIEEEKAYRVYVLNDGERTGPKPLRACTSSKIEIPEEITDRIKNAKKLSQYEKAKEDATIAYEEEMSRRIKAYSTSRQDAIKLADDFGQGVSLNPIRGEDYFFDDGTRTAYSSYSNVNPASNHFDSASTVTFPDKGFEGCFDSSCPPVYLDPNYEATNSKKAIFSKDNDTNPDHDGCKTMTKIVVKSSAHQSDINDDDDSVSITDSID